uniref:non-specific serine/threonine protein kinase n=1 Tax=Panagrellus redivivus TaxID=6233 RepID=A0A7E4V7Q4_PANRE
MVPQKSACVCATLRKRPCTRLSDPIGLEPKFAHSAKTVSFKDAPPTLFAPYDSSRPYLEQAFRDIAEIGYGSFGVVYAATSRADGLQYAIKRSHNVYSTRSWRKRMLHEVQIHESLPPHKNLVNFVMAWEERDRLYIQIELCRRQSLADMRQCATCVTESAVLKWTKDMASALVHLHKHDIIHLDIKPDNMFIGADGHCKLGDFGSALNLATDNVDDFDDGDGRYLAPEILNNPPTKAADVYSLGMSMLELASGVDFASRKFNSRMEIHLAAFGCLKDVGLKQLIEDMTNLKPERRPSALGVLEMIFLLENGEQ